MVPLIVLPPHAIALPQGGQVVAGQVTSTYGAGALTLQQAGGAAIVNWADFGIGFDYFLGRHTSLRAAYGWQFTDSGSSESGDNARLHLSASLSF